MIDLSEVALPFDVSDFLYHLYLFISTLVRDGVDGLALCLPVDHHCEPRDPARLNFGALIVLCALEFEFSVVNHLV